MRTVLSCVDWKTENSVGVATKLPSIQKLGEATGVRDTGAVTILALLRPTASQCTSRGTLWIYRLPSHISKMVLPTIHVGPTTLKSTVTPHDGRMRGGQTGED